MDATTQQPTQIVLVSSPGMGHLIPLLQFAKRLLPRFSFTFAIPSDGAPPSSSHRSFLSSLPDGIHAVFLPPVSLSDAPSASKAETLISLTLARSLPALRDLLSHLPRVAALVVDLFGTDAFDVASEFGLPSYIFFPSTAMTLSLFLHLDTLDRTVSSEYADLSEPVQFPGCIPVHGRDLADPVQDRKDDTYKWLLHHSRRFTLAEGILVNSFDALEAGAISALSEPGPSKPPVYSIGPLVQTGSGNKLSDRPECLTWLDEQPRGSVLFVNFGSGGTLGRKQQEELAIGLEKSKQRFLWVIRMTNDSVSNAAFFGVDGQGDPLRTLPEGFLERTAGRGLVVPAWAPQIEVLSHGSTGGFLSHCGWNSVLESVVHGVPLITWPLYAEQRMNAIMLAEGLRVGLRPRPGEDGVFRGDEIARVVVKLMEGEEGKRVRRRMEEMKDAASVVLGEDGSSTRALNMIAQKWESKV